MSRQCYSSKFKNFITSAFKNIKYQTNIRPYINYRKQNHKKIQFKNIVSWNRHEFLKGIFVATSIWYETKKEDVEENLAHLITLAKIALERGDTERAKDIIQLGLQISEKHKLYAGIPILYDILAAIYLSQGNVVQAQELLVTAIEKLTMWGYPEDHYNVVDFKLRLARIYSASGNSSLAKMGFETCLNQQKAKILQGDTTEKTGILYVNILFWYGVHMIRNDNYREARNMINTAFEYSTKIKGLSPKQEMIILYTLSDLNSELGDYNMALKCMLNAVVLGKGIGSIDLPVCYLKLGTVYQKLGFIKQAQTAYEDALKSAKTFGFFDVVNDAESALQNLLNNDKN